jgi:hypothetical protein
MSGFHLSDPSHDFDRPESRELLSRIIAKQGVGLTGHDLACVFNSYLPAGTAQECCAYLRPLYQLFRTPQDDYAAQIWEDILWIWLQQERAELEKLNQHSRIIDELRRIVHDTLIPATWQTERGSGEISTRADMLTHWMASPWGNEELPRILTELAQGGFSQQLLLLRLFLKTKEALFCPGEAKEAILRYRGQFVDFFRESTALYDALEQLETHAIDLPANDASGSTTFLYETADECRLFL